MIRLFKWVSTMRQNDEEKYVDLFKQIKIGEGFYFSYTYDLTHTLQNNILKQVKNNNKASGEKSEPDKNAFYQDAEESSDSEDEGNSHFNNRSQSVASQQMHNLPPGFDGDTDPRLSLHKQF